MDSYFTVSEAATSIFLSMQHFQTPYRTQIVKQKQPKQWKEALTMKKQQKQPEQRKTITKVAQTTKNNDKSGPNNWGKQQKQPEQGYIRSPPSPLSSTRSRCIRSAQTDVILHHLAYNAILPWWRLHLSTHLQKCKILPLQKVFLLIYASLCQEY